MKIVDDKLKIIDDVPTSAVEMAVKEKVRHHYYFFILCIKHFFTVPQKSPKTRTDRGGNQNCAQTLLQSQKNHQRRLQRYFTQMCT